MTNKVKDPFAIEQSDERKIYRANLILPATFLGGPLCAGYIIAENFKTFGDNHKVGATWTISILSTVAIFLAVFKIPDSIFIPPQLIPLVYSGIAYGIISVLQGREIEAYVIETGRVFSAGRSVVIGLIGAVTTIIPVIGYFVMADPMLTASNKTYGQLNHEIYFDESTISDSEVDRVAEALTQTLFFDDVQQKSIFIKAIGSKYFLSIPVTGNAWNDRETVAYFESLRRRLTPLLYGNPIIIHLCSDGDITDVKRVLGAVRSKP